MSIPSAPQIRLASNDQAKSRDYSQKMPDPLNLRKFDFDPQSDDHWRHLTERARVEGRTVWLELLQDRLIWNKAPAWAQDQAIEAASEELGPPFQFRDTAFFECGGQRHRIASFQFLGESPSLELPKTNTLDWTFRLLPGGRFVFGSSDLDLAANRNEKPPRELAVPPFLIAATPATRSMWRRFPHEPADDRPESSLPVELNWNEATEKLAELQSGLRLPSEVEWEYACRAGTQSSYCFGNDPEQLPQYAWFRDNANRQSQPVAQLEANAFGLYDVHGNVGEWCADHWRNSYQAGPPDHRPHHNPNTTLRALRGGNAICRPTACRSTIRGTHDARRYKAGFRITRSLT